MIGKLSLLLSLLQAVSGQWTLETPRTVTAQTGTCARIPCRCRYLPERDGEPRRGFWYWNGIIVYNSEDPLRTTPTFRNRSLLSRDLKSGDCSLLINRIGPGDGGSYRFRVEFDKPIQYGDSEEILLHVTDFTDRPLVFPGEMVAGEAVNINCIFNTSCNAELPTLTWINPPTGPVSNSNTQHKKIITLTSVLSLTASPEHHGQNLTCRVSYPTVWSEQTLTFSVQHKKFSIWKKLLISVGAIFSVIVAAVFSYMYIHLRKTKGTSETQDPAVSYSTSSASNKAQMGGGTEDTAWGFLELGNE
ncbi:sialic acid-binding Ig-like lectin 12 isoform X2 [Narcine bancroftii]